MPSGSYADAADAQLLSRTARDPDRGTARAWLFGIARHELADVWERGRVEDQARRRLGIEPLALSDETLEQIEALGSRAGREALELLAALPDDQRRAVQGRVLEERDYHELARTLAARRASLVRAAARQPEAPRRSRGWFGVAAAATVAVAVVAVAIVLVGHGRTGQSLPVSHGAPAPPTLPHFAAGEFVSIEAAQKTTARKDPACVAQITNLPAATLARPAPALVQAVGALRRARSAADALPNVTVYLVPSATCTHCGWFRGWATRPRRTGRCSTASSRTAWRGSACASRSRTAATGRSPRLCATTGSRSRCPALVIPAGDADLVAGPRGPDQDDRSAVNAVRPGTCGPGNPL
jgi:hypothetical protein